MKIETVKTSVEFKTGDNLLQELYNNAEKCLKGNERDFGGRPVLVEGGGYPHIWIETQPMGGEMYAKRNMEAACNNSFFFMEYQGDSGRYPYKLTCNNGTVIPSYNQFQGFCFPHHALNLFYWNKKKNPEYLQKLYTSLEAYDAYLWKYRDSDGDGCLETWCAWDTGEDNCSRFAGTNLMTGGFPGEIPPVDPVFPIESMDFMGYSHDARLNLARISAVLKNGREGEWLAKAKQAADKICSYLWDEKRGACYDRDRHNEFMPALQHNNLRVMYHGAFSAEMANRFVREHLLNPEEFFTPVPLPSIAVNNPVFKNVKENDWSGQSEGLTFQRAIRALENYGFYSELALIGKKYLDIIAKHKIFPQQLDPFTGEASEPGFRGNYSPSALSVLEYISRFYGVHVQFDEIWWGALGRGEHELSYTQHWDGDSYTVETKGGKISGSLNGKEIFLLPKGLRAVSDWQGRVKSIINTSGESFEADFVINGEKGKAALKANEVFFKK